MRDEITMTKPNPLARSVITTDRQMSVVRFSPCGRLLAAAGRDAAIRLWEISGLLESDASAPTAEPGDKPRVPAKKDAKLPEATVPELPRLTGHNGWVTGLAFHPTESRLYSGDSWGKLTCWTHAGNEFSRAWTIDSAHDGWLRQVAVSPDGRSLATCGRDGRVRLWSCADGNRLQEIDVPGGDVYSLAFHPDGKSLVFGDLRGIIRQWDFATNTLGRELDASVFYLLAYIQDVGGVRSLAFSDDGQTLVAAGAQPTTGGFVQGTPVVRIFEWESGTVRQTLTLGDATEVFVHEILYHPDGYWIGVVSGQPGKGKFFLLNAEEAQPFFSTENLANCHSAALHPDGRRLAVISNAGTFGQAKSRAREGDYPGNVSPIQLWELTSTTANV